jgi:hypothetical protein
MTRPIAIAGSATSGGARTDNDLRFVFSPTPSASSDSAAAPSSESRSVDAHHDSRRSARFNVYRELVRQLRRGSLLPPSPRRD